MGCKQSVGPSWSEETPQPCNDILAEPGKCPITIHHDTPQKNNKHTVSAPISKTYPPSTHHEES